MKIFTKSPLLLCIIARFSVTCSLIKIVQRIDEFYKGNGNQAIEWIGGDELTLCFEESLIPSGYERASINALFLQMDITLPLPLPQRHEVRMVTLKCVYTLFLGHGYTMSSEFYVSGMNGEILRVGAPDSDDPNVWTIIEEVTVSFISRNKYRITSYTQAMNVMTGAEKLLEKYYKGYGVVPWRWNPEFLIIGISRIRESVGRRPVKSFLRTGNIVLERNHCTKIEMEVLFLAYNNHVQGFVSGLNGEIISVGRPSCCPDHRTIRLRTEVFGGGHILPGNMKLWGVANVFRIFNSQRRDKSGKVSPAGGNRKRN